MIIDTSAVVALLLGEPESTAIERALLGEPCAMSAATRVELGLLIEARNGPAGALLLAELATGKQPSRR